MGPAWALTANTERINNPKLNTFIFPADRCQYLLICFLLATLAILGDGPLRTGNTLARSLMLSRLIIFATSCKHLQPPHKLFSPKKMVEIAARLRFERISVADNYPDCREQHVTQV